MLTWLLALSRISTHLCPALTTATARLYGTIPRMDLWMTLGNLVTGAVGGTAAVFGLFKYLGNWWLERQKASYSKELEEFRHALEREQRRVQAEIDRSVFVTRAHFETEFAAMKDVYKCLSEVHLTLNGVRPAFRVEPMNESRDDQLKRLGQCLGELQRAYDNLLTQSNALEPFYPADLYAAVEECKKAAYTEITDVQLAGDDAFTSAWYTQGKTNCNRFEVAYKNASKVIRERIEKLAVLPST